MQTRMTSVAAALTACCALMALPVRANDCPSTTTGVIIEGDEGNGTGYLANTATTNAMIDMCGQTPCEEYCGPLPPPSYAACTEYLDINGGDIRTREYYDPVTGIYTVEATFLGDAGTFLFKCICPLPL